MAEYNNTRSSVAKQVVFSQNRRGLQLEAGCNLEKENLLACKAGSLKRLCGGVAGSE